jgi:hypothetical protein
MRKEIFLPYFKIRLRYSLEMSEEKRRAWCQQILSEMHFVINCSWATNRVGSIYSYAYITCSLTWHKHSFAKRKQPGITLTKMYWLLGRKPKLSTSNKCLIYKSILKPIWTYEIQLWGTASTSNIGILERFQSKALRMIVDAPGYVPNTVIRRDLQTPTIKEEIRRYSSRYSVRLSADRNDLVVNLMEQPDNNRRLRRHLPNDLPTRFLV